MKRVYFFQICNKTVQLSYDVSEKVLKKLPSSTAVDPTAQVFEGNLLKYMVARCGEQLSSSEFCETHHSKVEVYL